MKLKQYCSIKALFLSSLLILPFILNAQIAGSNDRLLPANAGLTVGGYGEVHFSQPMNNDPGKNALLDVRRFVLLINQRFSDKVRFFTEIEFEHVSEVFVEQAFLQYTLSSRMQIRGGLLLIPAGIINIAHEPTTFNGVERPWIDITLVPTTWREIGIGISGNLIGPSLKYELSLMNGFKGYDDRAVLSGATGLRKARQKGSEAVMQAPDLAARIEYYGLRGLTIGLSGYSGTTESNLYDGISRGDKTALARADSSVTRIILGGVDLKYEKQGIQLRGQVYYISLPDAGRYNLFASSYGEFPDLGTVMAGFYIEGAYELFRKNNAEATGSLIPFVRYGYYNTHQKVPAGTTADPAFRHNLVTTGVGWKPVPGAVVKTDIQWNKSGNEAKFSPLFHAGVGVTF